MTVAPPNGSEHADEAAVEQRVALGEERHVVATHDVDDAFRVGVGRKRQDFDALPARVEEGRRELQRIAAPSSVARRGEDGGHLLEDATAAEGQQVGLTRAESNGVERAPRHRSTTCVDTTNTGFSADRRVAPSMLLARATEIC